MSDVQVLAPGVKAAPLDYVIPGAQEILVKAIAADFNGATAGATFVPAIQIIAPGGKLAGTFISNGQVAAGSSASVSWAPFLAGAGPNGIQFDTNNQGGFLNVTTNAADPATSWGARLFDPSGGGILLISSNGGDTDVLADGTLLLEGRYIDIASQSAGVDIFGKTAVTITSQHTGGSLNAVQVVTNADDSFTHKDATSGAILFQSTTHGVWGFLRANATFTLFDHNGAAILQVEENGPNYRIKAGKAWVANL